jgi:hypothetical protein
LLFHSHVTRSRVYLGQTTWKDSSPHPSTNLKLWPRYVVIFPLLSSHSFSFSFLLMFVSLWANAISLSFHKPQTLTQLCLTKLSFKIHELGWDHLLDQNFMSLIMFVAQGKSTNLFSWKSNHTWIWIIIANSSLLFETFDEYVIFLDQNTQICSINLEVENILLTLIKLNLMLCQCAYWWDEILVEWGVLNVFPFPSDHSVIHCKKKLTSKNCTRKRNTWVLYRYWFWGNLFRFNELNIEFIKTKISKEDKTIWQGCILDFW